MMHALARWTPFPFWAKTDVLLFGLLKDALNRHRRGTGRWAKARKPYPTDNASSQPKTESAELR